MRNAIWSCGELKTGMPFEEAMAAIREEKGIVWIDLDANETSSLWVRTNFDFSDTTVHSWEDVECRARAEDYGDYVYVLLHRLGYSEEAGVESTNYHCYLGKNYIVTAHSGGDGPVDEAMRLSSAETICRQGPDMLFYLLANELVESNFPILDSITEEVESIEEEMYTSADRDTPRKLYAIKRNLLILRRHTSPMREVFGYLARKENRVIDPDVLPYIWDLYDRTLRISELVDVNREIVSGALEMYMTIVSNRMNEKMTALTVVSVVFLPLTVIVGYYGMNFRHFPELGWKWGLPFIWALMIAVSAVMIWFFAKKKWL